ncbi:Metallo-dependent phosphatase-like protein [Dunaliella salina]|uniref:Metallo-dependent phosphatase-like protein n=1 Tax=Dunaliella salina TaxID=3046 RepID=A0ABQ7GDD6_DUNSA|nr:Metallo-dependent phosphatase-like protein [Dunaliella salina]|eukprot:KAF5832626.1 Metallo-dependent phosphatase-like protein [Dunaliella salina]
MSFGQDARLLAIHGCQSQCCLHDQSSLFVCIPACKMVDTGKSEGWFAHESRVHERKRKRKVYASQRPCASREEPLTKVRGLTRWLVHAGQVGDWGRGGTANQRHVAALMGRQSQCYKPSFVLSTGDNFYSHGLRGPHDPYFAQTFTNVYTSEGLQVPWYSVLGNHDYGEFGGVRGGCMAPEFSLCPKDCCYSASWQDSLTIPSITGRESVAASDPRWNLKQGVWRKSFGAGDLLDVVFTDTTPFMRRYRHRAWGNMSGGVLRQDVYKQFVEIQSLMRNSSATWKLVVGHHPIQSYGEHCNLRGDRDCLDMQFLKPVLQKYKADFYMSGHDHGIQLLKDPGSGVHFLVSGAGSNTKRGHFKNVHGNDTLFLSDQPGFVAVSIKGNNLRLDTFSIHSPNPTYAMSIDKEQ